MKKICKVNINNKKNCLNLNHSIRSYSTQKEAPSGHFPLLPTKILGNKVTSKSTIPIVKKVLPNNLELASKLKTSTKEKILTNNAKLILKSKTIITQKKLDENVKFKLNLTDYNDDFRKILSNEEFITISNLEKNIPINKSKDELILVSSWTDRADLWFNGFELVIKYFTEILQSRYTIIDTEKNQPNFIESLRQTHYRQYPWVQNVQFELGFQPGKSKLRKLSSISFALQKLLRQEFLFYQYIPFQVLQQGDAHHKYIRKVCELLRKPLIPEALETMEQNTINQFLNHHVKFVCGYFPKVTKFLVDGHYSSTYTEKSNIYKLSQADSSNNSKQQNYQSNKNLQNHQSPNNQLNQQLENKHQNNQSQSKQRNYRLENKQQNDQFNKNIQSNHSQKK